MSKSNKITQALDSNALGPFSHWSFPISAFLAIVAAAMVVLSLLPNIVPPRYSNLVVPGLLLGLTCAVVLHLVTLARAKDVQSMVDSAFDITDREFASVFRNTLDGILILDDHGFCLDANPAAFTILGTTAGELTGKPLSRFYADPNGFDTEWARLQKEGGSRGQASLIRADGGRVFVDYTYATNCVPGRHLLVLCDTTRRSQAENSLRRSEERFQQIADRIQEIFWVMDADTKEVIFVNRAYEAITGRSVSSLYRQPSSYRDYIHPDDRVHVLAKLEEAVSTGNFDEEFRILRPNGDLRWVSAKALPVRDSGQLTSGLIGTVQDVTARKRAELESGAQIAAAEAARAEAEALRKSALILTENLAMDAVLDTLLACLGDLVPYSSAAVILAEDLSHLFVAREAPRTKGKRNIITLAAKDQPSLQSILVEHKSVYLPDTRRDEEWRDHPAFAGTRCWMGVPLLASGHVLGILSVGSDTVATFTMEHLRLAKSLAIPAAVAIQNARLYERAEIYAAELQLRLKQLRAEDHGEGR
jgi:PAS domain S-box-containing protein